MDESLPRESTPTSTPSRRRRLFVVAVIALALIVVGYGAYWFWNARNALPNDQMLVLASDGFPLAAAQTLLMRDGSLAPITVEGQGTAVVVDAVITDDAGYYLVSDPGFTQANLYRQDRADPGAGLAQLTNSASIKFSLSYDDLSGTAAYVSVNSDGESRIVVWNPATNTEKDLGPGTNPILLPGGFFVLHELGESLVSVRVETGEIHQILSLTAGMPFAVDRENLKIALYEPVTGALQEYSIAGMTGASYLSSIPVAVVPQELVYVSGTLVRIQSDEAASALIIGETTRPLSPSVIDALSVNRNLSTYD